MGSKKKFLSQVETEASISPMMELVTERKNKKDKKKKLMSPFDTHLNESYDDDAFEVKQKKSKKKKKDTADSEINNLGEFAQAYEDKEKKKKRDKKYKESTSDDLDVNDNSNIMETEGSPKKKNKKKKKHAEDEESYVKEGEDISQEQDLIESSFSDSSPKKKKKKKKKSLDSDSSFILKSPEETKKCDITESIQSSRPSKKRKDVDGEEPGSILLSPKKKKGEKHASEDFAEAGKSNKKHKEIKRDVKEGVNGNFKEIYESDLLWSVEEEVFLITRLRESLSSEDEIVAYKKSLSGIKWEDIAFDCRSANECKNKLEKMLSKLIKQKSLKMLLQEAEHYSRGHKNIKTPRARFQQSFFKKKKADPDYKPDQNKDIIRESNLEWGKMLPEEKVVYEVEYRNELEQHRKLMDLPPEHPRVPVSIYYDIQIKKLGTKSNELRKKLYKTFNEMDFHEKIPYIHESVKEYFRYGTALEDYQQSHPDWKEKRKVRICHHLFQEYVEYLDMPKYFCNGFSFFAYEKKINGALNHIDGKDKLKHLNAMYQTLSEEEKAKCAEQAKSAQSTYLEKYNSWIEKQDEAVAYLVKKHFEHKAVTKLRLGTFSNVVEMSMTKPKFTGEPEKPPTAFKLFYLKFERRCRDKYSSKEDMRDDCLAAWKVLPQKNKVIYEKRAKQNQEIYKESLLEYVRSLGHSAGVYLGFLRKAFFKYFHEDIFEKDFPNANYPVYVSPKQTAKILTYDEDVSDKKSSRKKTKGDSGEGSIESETNLDISGTYQGSSKSARKISKTASSLESDGYDDMESDDETEVSQAWPTEKNESVIDEEDDDDDDDDEEEEDEEDSDQD